MCAPIPRGVHLRFNNLHNNLHSRVFSARRVLALESRETIILPPIPQNIPQNTAPQVEPSLTLTNLPVTTLPPTALSPSESVLIPGSSGQGVQTLSIASFVSTIPVISSAYVSSSSLSVTTLTSSFAPNSALSKTVVPTVPLSSGSAAISPVDAPVSTWNVSSTHATSSLVSTATISPVTTIAPVISQSSDLTVTTTSYTSIQGIETDTSLSESFIPVPSSTLPTLADPSSSITISSTTNNTTPAVNTVTASPIAVKPASLSTHNPPLYIGIVLGTIAAIACLCALIAWFVRLRGHARRRRAARSLKLPWAKSDGDTWGLESGHGPVSDTDLAALSVMNLGSREDLAHVQAWSPRGDRDVGEPRRTESYMQGSTYSLQNHPIPEHCLFSDDSVRAFASSEGYSTASLIPHHNLRQLPSHLIDQELAARVSREHASLRSNDNIGQTDFPSRTNRDCGTPRETMDKPRFLSLKGGGLNVPWCPTSDSSPRSMVERLRNHCKPLPTEPPWQQITPRQNSSGTNLAEPWSTSLRGSLVSAFNAVAANLSSAAGVPRMNDQFTPAPPKRTVRKSVRGTFWDHNLAKAKDPSRESSVSTTTSKAWTLEETRDGAGVVRFFVPDLQGCDDETGIQRPHLSGPTLSFGDGHDIYSGDDNSRRRIVERPQVPLIASEKPPPAVTQPDPYHIRCNTRKIVNSPLSRAGSIYSTASTRIGVQTKNLVASETSSLIIPSTSANPYCNDSSDSIVIEPSQISRLSSSDSSNILHGSTSEIEEGLNAASWALKERRTRSLGLAPTLI